MVARLPEYLQVLDALAAEGHSTVSSEELAGRCSVSSAVLRRDFSHLSAIGVRGVGYDVASLRGLISRFLGTDVRRPVVILGAGRLGSAFADYVAMRISSFDLAGVFDVDPRVLGTAVGGMTVRPESELAVIAERRRIDLAVIAVPAQAAQAAADAAANAGITGILNFAPVVISVPEHVTVRRVDLSTELKVLAYYTSAAMREQEN